MSRYADIVAKQAEPEVVAPIVDSSPAIRQVALFEPKVWNPPFLPTNGNFARWQTAYYKHLFDLRNILSEKLSEKVPEMADYFYSEEFFGKFCRFIRTQSSGRITSFSETMV